MKEIGGYFQLEEMPGEEYYPDLYRVNLGRTALLDRKSTRLNSSHSAKSRMPSSA